MSIVVLACFAILAIVHLYACAKGKQKLRRYTKPFLMPLLFLWYVLFVREPSTFVALALWCGCAGDFFLLHDEKKKNLFAGIGCFAAGHVCYLLFLIPRIQWPAWWLLTLIVLGYLVGLVVTCLHLRPHAKGELFYGSAGYALLLCVMSACAGLYALSGGGILPWIGSLLFLGSDFILSNEILIKETRYGTLAVMSTYIAAQFLLILGFSLL